MMRNKFKNMAGVCTFILLYCLTSVCFSSQLNTELSDNHIALGESIVVTYTISNYASNVDPDFSPLNKDFRILNTNYGNSFKMVNGVTTSETFWRLVLEPQKAGEIVLPEITFGSEKSAPQRIEVTGNQITQAESSTKNLKPPVFVSGDVSSTSPYVQSQFLYTFKLYFRSQISNPRVEIPQIMNVTFVPLNKDKEYRTTINNQTYNVVEKTFAVFTKKPGAVSILPFKFHAVTVDEGNGFSNDFFNVYNPKPITLLTKTFNLTVRDAPSTYQGTTWLPAKNVALSEQWSDEKPSWDAGTPVTRTITLEAQGLRADQLPDLTFNKTDNMNVYIDRPKRHNIIQHDTLIGVLEQKVTYIPSSAASFTFPPVKINWWNTETNTNAVTELEGKTIQVKGSTSIVPPAIQSSSPASGVKNIIPANKIIESANPANAFYTSIWFWLTCALLAAWMITLYVMLRRKPAVNKKANTPDKTTTELTDKFFEHACLSGQAIQAQQFLLAWAKKHNPASSLNLASLQKCVKDEDFQLAVGDLEQALYAKQNKAWNGQSLLNAYQKIKKSKVMFPGEINDQEKDLLPPLNPSI